MEDSRFDRGTKDEESWSRQRCGEGSIWDHKEVPFIAHEVTPTGELHRPDYCPFWFSLVSDHLERHQHDHAKQPDTPMVS
jgi:hypothetical protein